MLKVMARNLILRARMDETGSCLDELRCTNL